MKTIAIEKVSEVKTSEVSGNKYVSVTFAKGGKVTEKAGIVLLDEVEAVTSTINIWEESRLFKVLPSLAGKEIAGDILQSVTVPAYEVNGKMRTTRNVVVFGDSTAPNWKEVCSKAIAKEQKTQVTDNQSLVVSLPSDMVEQGVNPFA